MSAVSGGGLTRNYLVPAVALAMGLCIVIADANRALFLFFNGLGPLSGDALWANWTALGDAWVLTALILPFVGRHPSMVWSLVVTAFITAIVVQVTKAAWALPRPPAVLAADMIHLIGPGFTSRSFPSGHTAAAFAFAGVLCRYFRGAWPVSAALAFAAGVGVSRMAVGVHWPLDVAAGAGIGWLCAVAGDWVAGRWRWGESLTGQRAIALLLVMAALALLFFFKADSPLASLLPKGVAIAVLLAGLPGLARLRRDRGTLP